MRTGDTNDIVDLAGIKNTDQPPGHPYDTVED
jgi:hypothetical protein